jgi:hypothetical protein
MRKTVDAVEVQAAIQPTGSRGEAVRVLKERLGWITSGSNLSHYVKRHALTAPWIKQPQNVSGDLLSKA